MRHYDGETIFFVYTSMAVYISHNNGAGPHSGLMLTLGSVSAQTTTMGNSEREMQLRIWVQDLRQTIQIFLKAP